jgi:predicted porin
MIGGLLKSASRLALVASAGVIVGAYGTQAQAADLGGDCCADLEERVAELEATTARKGNRKVSLAVYGQVNEMVLFWDDGGMSDVYQTGNDVSRTRFGFRGSAKIDSDWSAGYLIEIGIRTADSASVSQFADVAGAIGSATEPAGFAPGDDLGANNGDLRHAYWYIDSKSLGRLTIGQTDTPASSTFTLTLANIPMAEADPTNIGAGFRIRGDDGTLSNVFWRNLMHPNEGSLSRRNQVLYTSPEFAGFQFKAAWGEADYWAVSLQYAGEFSGFRLAAKAAYADISDSATFAVTPIAAAGNTSASTAGCVPEGGPFDDSNHREVDCNHWAVGASLMHVPTGLFVSGGYVSFTDNNRQDFLPLADDNDVAWYIQGGIEQKFFALGKTTLYGEYGEQENGNLGFFAAGLEDEHGTTMSFWGLGLVQNIEAAAMDMYLFYRNLSSEVPSVTPGGGNPGQDMQLIGAGAIIRF